MGRRSHKNNEVNPNHAVEYITNPSGWKYSSTCGCRACISRELAESILFKLDSSHRTWEEDSDMIFILRSLCELMKKRGLVPAGVENVAVAVLLKINEKEYTGGGLN